MFSVHVVDVTWVTTMQLFYFACADAACDVLLPEGVFLISLRRNKSKITPRRVSVPGCLTAVTLRLASLARAVLSEVLSPSRDFGFLHSPQNLSICQSGWN